MVEQAYVVPVDNKKLIEAALGGMMTALAAQLGGRVTVTGGAGTLVRVTFPAPDAG